MSEKTATCGLSQRWWQVVCNKVSEKPATCGLSQRIWQLVCKKVSEKPATCGLSQRRWQVVWKKRFRRNLLPSAYPKTLASVLQQGVGETCYVRLIPKMYSWNFSSHYQTTRRNNARDRNRNIPRSGDSSLMSYTNSLHRLTTHNTQRTRSIPGRYLLTAHLQKLPLIHFVNICGYSITFSCCTKLYAY